MDREPTQAEFLVHKAEQYIKQFNSNENNLNELEEIKKNLVRVATEISTLHFLGSDLIADYIWNVVFQIEQMMSVAE